MSDHNWVYEIKAKIVATEKAEKNTYCWHIKIDCAPCWWHLASPCLMSLRVISWAHQRAQHHIDEGHHGDGEEW